MRAVVDRIEDGFAVLLFGDQEIKVDMPRELLPHDLKEGDILNVTVEVDQRSTQAQRQKIEGLLQKLKEKNK
jgi:hypothetical protein